MNTLNILAKWRREGFEPSIRDKPYTPLAGERLQPLGHLHPCRREHASCSANSTCFKINDLRHCQIIRSGATHPCVAAIRLNPGQATVPLHGCKSNGLTCPIRQSVTGAASTPGILNKDASLLQCLNITQRRVV